MPHYWPGVWHPSAPLDRRLGSKILLLLALAVLPQLTNAFSRPLVLRTRRVAARHFRLRYKGESNIVDEKTVRLELLDKQTKLPKDVDEKEFSIVDGGPVDGLFIDKPDSNKVNVSTTLDESKDSSLAAVIERITRPRAYPLFILEKCAEIAEGILGSILHLPKTRTNKEKILILGTGWGAAAFIRDIDTDLYDVTVISPRNYFLFTPMLAGASVGSVEYRSITQPIREINPKVLYIEAIATDIDPATNTVVCESVSCEGNACDTDTFEVNYDRLVVTIGAQPNTFGIPGVREHCSFLKQVEDARRIRTAIVNCFERANLPKLSDEEKADALSFVIIGAGPSGVEMSAELRDFIEQDGPKYYPKLLKYVHLRVIDAASSVLSPFDKALQEEAVRQLKREVTLKDPRYTDVLPPNFELTEVQLGVSVKEVGEHTIYLNNGDGFKYALAVWAAGNGPLPLTLQLIDSLGSEQKKQQETARGFLAVDPWLRCIGGEGRIFALGDCSSVTTGRLPATAQVAAQQAEFLAGLFNKEYDMDITKDEGIVPPPSRNPERGGMSLSESIAAFAMGNSQFARPFQFWDLGILAYIGNDNALAQVAVAPDLDPVAIAGEFGNTVWKSVYLSKQVSWRNRLLVVNDWMKHNIFGRDITRL